MRDSRPGVPCFVTSNQPSSLFALGTAAVTAVVAAFVCLFPGQPLEATAHALAYFGCVWAAPGPFPFVCDIAAHPRLHANCWVQRPLRHVRRRTGASNRLRGCTPRVAPASGMRRNPPIPLCWLWHLAQQALNQSSQSSH